MYSLSIIIPLYNEERRLLKSLTKLEKFILQNKKNKIEIIFVSDGSTDLTTLIIKQFIKKNKKNFKSYLIEYKKNIGKGYAVKKGILRSKNNWVLICDADMSVNPNQFNIWFKNKKIGVRIETNFPLFILKFLCIFQIKSGNPKNALILKIVVILCPGLTI